MHITVRLEEVILKEQFVRLSDFFNQFKTKIMSECVNDAEVRMLTS